MNWLLGFIVWAFSVVFVLMFFMGASMKAREFEKDD
jgi:hypothetical protein